MIVRRFLRALLGIGLAAGLAASAAAEDRSLLTPDGTLYHVQSGLYSAFEPNGTLAQPTDFVIHWNSVDQSGATQSGIIPGTNNGDAKDQFDLAYDSLSKSLVLTWSDRIQMLSSIQFAIFQNSAWSQAELLPSGIFSFAVNPTISVMHQTVQDLDANGNEIDTQRSVISVIWWEGSVQPRARFAPIFVENGNFDFSDIQIYDMPELVGSQTVIWPAIISNPLFANPTLQADGTTGLVAAFADVATNTLQVARITFPSDFRYVIDPMHGRHVVVILGHNSSPVLASIPPTPSLVGMVVGGSYQPTVYWQNDPSSVNYAMTDGTNWTAPKTIALTRTLTSDGALALIRKMAIQN